MFKVCPCCGKEWITQKEFLEDTNVTVISYKPDFMELKYGQIFFNHLIDSCKSTITLFVLAFENLYSGVRYHENRAESKECPRFCLDKDQLNRCDQRCECAYVREILSILKHEMNQLHN